MKICKRISCVVVKEEKHLIIWRKKGKSTESFFVCEMSLLHQRIKEKLDKKKVFVVIINVKLSEQNLIINFKNLKNLPHHEMNLNWKINNYGNVGKTLL